MSQTFNPLITYPDDGSFPHTPGERVVDHEGREFIFCRCSNAVAKGRVAVIETTHDAQRVSAAASGLGDRCGVALLVDIPAGYWGWLCTYGTGDVQVLANAAANAALYTSNTSGVLDDTAGGHSRIAGLFLTTARGGTNGPAPAVWYYPHVAS